MTSHRVRTTMGAALLAALLCIAGTCAAQDAPASGQGAQGGRGQFGGMQRVGGEVTAVTGSQVSLKTADGTVMQVATNENTRVMKAAPGADGPGQPTPIKLADLKVGDGVMAAGNLDAPNKTLHAVMLFATDAAVLKAARENLGKTYIAGRVTAIDVDNLKMTVQRSDGVSQTIGFDEGTSFKRGGRGMRMNMGGGGMGQGGGMGAGGGAGAGRRGAQAGGAASEGESITLADIKVGDNIAGNGSVKKGTFVPTQLNVMTPRPRREGGPAGEPGSAPAAAPAAAPKP